MEAIEESYQVFVCHLGWLPKQYGTNRKNAQIELPEQMSIDIPEAVLQQARKNKANFNDIIEQFTYNLLSKKFGRDLCHCQIWLPLED